MSQFFVIHPENPQARLISQAVTHIRDGGVIIYPTDSGYALGCLLENKTAMERICRIRNLDSSHNFTLVCRDLSELSLYARVDNQAFRLIKNNTPGPYTFILQATKEVPRRLMNEKKKTVRIGMAWQDQFPSFQSYLPIIDELILVVKTPDNKEYLGNMHENQEEELWMTVQRVVIENPIDGKYEIHILFRPKN